MPLPAPHTPWPPAPIRPALQQVSSDSAWLEGDVARFSHLTTNPVGTPSPRGGLLGALAGSTGPSRRPGTAGTITDLHLPMPYRMATASADLLVGTPPGFTLHESERGNEKATEFLNRLTTTDEFAADLHRSFTYSAGLGWTFGRVVWNEAVQPDPWIDWVDADQGWAEWQHGRVSAITFWTELPDPDGKDRVRWRSLERHEIGMISYGLYKGSDLDLGARMPLTAHPETQHLHGPTHGSGTLKTGVNTPTAVLLPNTEGNPRWRKSPQLRKLGISDIQKGGTVWGVIDRIWGETVRELDAARARLLVSEELLDDDGPGRGQSFDMGRDVFTLGQTADPNAGGKIEKVQFDFRIEKFEQALDLAKAEALQAVGLSALTVGMESPGAAMTATEIEAKSTATMNTWAGKARLARAGLSALATGAVAVHAGIHGYAPPERPVDVSLQDPIQETELDRTQAARNLREARAASTRYLVRRLHPEWTPEQVDEEVAEIRTEDGPTDPFILPPDSAPAEGFPIP